MQDTASGTLALPGKEAAFSSSVLCLKVFGFPPQEGLLIGADLSEKGPCLRRTGDSCARTFRNAFAALAAIFKNREADLAWPKRSKGKKVPA